MIRKSTARIAQAERDLVLLADALNQYAIQEDDVLVREIDSATDRLNYKEADRYRTRRRALLHLREKVAEVIARLDP